MKAKPFTSFARALLRGQDFFTPAFFLPLFGSFFQSIWSGPQESAPWFVFPPHIHLSKLILLPCSRWISKRHFSGMSSCSLPQPFLHLTPNKADFSWPTNECCQKFTWNEMDMTGSSSVCKPGEMYTCSATLLSCSCVAQRFKTSRLLDKNINRNKGTQSCMLLGAG